MKIHNHGLDTIQIAFTHDWYCTQNKSYSFSPTTLANLSYRLHTTYNISKSSGKVKNNHWFSFDGIRCFSNDRITLLEFSVGKLLYGHNIYGVPLDELERVMKYLEERLGVDPRKARLKRLDYNFNFGTYIPISTIHDHISINNGLFRPKLDVGSLYHYNKSREVTYYSQVNGRYKEVFELNLIEKIKRETGYPELFRVEYRFKERGLTKGPICFEDLLHNEWQDWIRKKIHFMTTISRFEDQPCLEDNTIYNFNIPNLKDKNDKITFKDFCSIIMAHLYNDLDYTCILKHVEEHKSSFKLNNHYKAAKAMITDGYNHRNKGLTSCENISDIPKLIQAELVNI